MLQRWVACLSLLIMVAVLAEPANADGGWLWYEVDAAFAGVATISGQSADCPAPTYDKTIKISGLTAGTQWTLTGSFITNGLTTGERFVGTVTGPDMTLCMVDGIEVVGSTIFGDGDFKPVAFQDTGTPYRWPGVFTAGELHCLKGTVDRGGFVHTAVPFGPGVDLGHLSISFEVMAPAGASCNDGRVHITGGGGQARAVSCLLPAVNPLGGFVVGALSCVKIAT